MKALRVIKNIDGIEVVGVITSPSKFSISYQPQGKTNYMHADLVSFCVDEKIDYYVYNPQVDKNIILKKITKWKPSAYVVIGWYHLIPKSWREIAPAYGIHASLLPKYKGGAPLVWALIEGETETGATLFEMSDVSDSGRVLDQFSIPIQKDDTIKTLYSRVMDRSMVMLEQQIKKISDGTAILRQQPKNNFPIMSQRSPEDGAINWLWKASQIDRWVRAQTEPYPGAFCLYQGFRLYIWHVRIHSEKKIKFNPGTAWLDSSGNYLVACGKGIIEIIEITYKNKRYREKEVSILFRGQKVFLESNAN